MTASAGIVIEPASEADLDALDALEQHAFKNPWPRQTFVDELRAAHARIDVARERGQVVGFANYWLVAGELHLHAIATHPDRRRAGIGARLLDHLLAAGRAVGATLATLEVRRGNTPAIALYERAGFKVVHTRVGYYQADGEDALVMLATL